MREENVESFIKVYAAKLAEVVEQFPDDYGYGANGVPFVVEKMKAAFFRGSYNHDGKAIKATCKALNIKHTRKAIEAYFNQAQTQAYSAVSVH